MNRSVETSDAGILELLRQNGPSSVAQLAAHTRVTATAVRQRLTRLMKQGSVERCSAPSGRGRPKHSYGLTEKARRQFGTNFGDLADVLWNEIRAVKDPDVRKGLYQRIAHSMAGIYAPQVSGETTIERMNSLAGIFSERNVPMVIDQHEHLPVLTALACPYPQLAERDRGICAVERMMFEEVLGANVRLDECRMTGDTCCRFTVN